MTESIVTTLDEMYEITDAADDMRTGSAQLVDAAGTLRDTADIIAGQVAELRGEFTALRTNLSAAA